MKFTKDTSKIKTFSGGPVSQTGFYSCTITKAYDEQSKSSISEAIHFDVVTSSGQYASFKIWYKGKTGEPNKVADAQLNDLMTLLDLDSLESKKGVVMIYDYDLKQDVGTKKMIYSDLINAEIGIVFDVKSQPKNKLVNGKWIPSGEMKLVPEFKQFADSET